MKIEKTLTQFPLVEGGPHPRLPSGSRCFWLLYRCPLVSLQVPGVRPRLRVPGKGPGSISSLWGSRPSLVRTECGLVLTLVSLSFQTSFPSSSPRVSGPSFLSGLGRAPQGQGQWGQPSDGGWPACPPQSRPRPPAPMWRSSSSPSSGACAFATSVRAAQQAVSQARGAQTPPRPTLPSRSAQRPGGGHGVSMGGTCVQAHTVCVWEVSLEFLSL